MSQQEGGTSIAVIQKVAISKNGKNWKYETDKGVFNLPLKKSPQQPNDLTLGKKVFFHWSWFEFTPQGGELIKMRMVNDWRDPGPNDKDFETTPSEPKQTQTKTQPSNSAFVPPASGPSKSVVEGWRVGQALNMGQQMAHMAGIEPIQPDYWPQVFAFADKALQATYTYEKGAGKFDAGF